MQENVVIQAEGISKRYRLGVIDSGSFFKKITGNITPEEEYWALRDVSFDVKRGEMLGIIGKNGAGKSTLLKILSQITKPTTGTIRIKGKVASLLEVGTGFHPELSGRDNIFMNGTILGMKKAEIKDKFDEIVDFSGVEKYIDTPVKRYSSGMYVRLAFAVAAHLEPEILIVDEVLAVGDAEFQKKCLGKMQDVAGHGRTVIFVSHNMQAVNRLCAASILLEGGKLIKHGVTSEIISYYLNSHLSEELVSRVIFEKHNNNIQINLIELLDTNKNLIKGILDTNSEIFLNLKYSFRKKINKLHLVVFIKNRGGEIVYIIDRADYANDFANVEPGNYSSIIKIPNPLLVPGRYTLTIGCSDNETGENDHKHDVLSMEISNISTYRQQRHGYIYKPVEWELKKEP